MRFTIEASKSHGFNTAARVQVTEGDVRALALAISRLHPEHQVRVTAHARIRLIVQIGVIEGDFPDYEEAYDLSEVSPSTAERLRREWRDMVASDTDLSETITQPVGTVTDLMPLMAKAQGAVNAWLAVQPLRPAVLGEALPYLAAVANREIAKLQTYLVETAAGGVTVGNRSPLQLDAAKALRHFSAPSKRYPGDCGAAGVPFAVTPDNWLTLVGRHIVTDDGVSAPLTVAQAQELGRACANVQLRTTLRCKHTDGWCEVCG